ncbi:MAG: hypothetical protein ACREBO_09580 [Novosphingobium sp.]
MAEVAIKFADAIDGHAHRPIGLLSPLLAVFVLCDVSSFWLFVWSIRDAVYLSFGTVIAALAVAIAYFLSAALIFPRSDKGWVTLDEHYHARKRYVLSGVVLASLVLIAIQASRATPRIDDFWFFFWQAAYFGPIAVLWFAKSHRANLAALIALVCYYPFDALNVFPNSSWGVATGMS